MNMLVEITYKVPVNNILLDCYSTGILLNYVVVFVNNKTVKLKKRCD